MDPISLSAIALGALGGGVASQAASSGSGAATPAAPDAPPPAAAPQQAAGAKPKAKPTQPSFLAGASMLPSGAAASGGPTGKSLLGQ